MMAHRSEGTEGVGRRIVLTIQNPTTEAVGNCEGTVDTEAADSKAVETLVVEKIGPPISNFSALSLDESDDSEAGGETTTAQTNDREGNILY